MIEVKNISKSFGDKQVLKNVSAVFEKGKTNLIIGQSGSGKSVLTKCIVRLLDVDQGDILYNGRDICDMERKELRNLRKEIGMLFQGGALFDFMTVEENVMFPLTMFKNMSVEEMRDRANFCLDRVNLENTNHLYPAETSGGMQKRIAIARAISMNPEYLFCDEPNSGLDPQTAIVIDNLIQEITHEFNMTTIVVTHDMNSVMEIGEHINFIYKGELWWNGTKDDIIQTDNKEVNDFVYVSPFMREFKDKMKRK